MSIAMSVAERVNKLKSIFNDFGIPVLPNSALEQAITSEFKRGKRSPLTLIISELQQESDAARLSKQIGIELGRNIDDPEVLIVAQIMQQRLPSLLNILDLRQTIHKREKLLSELLSHFKNKITTDPQTARLHRMLDAAYHNLNVNIQVHAMGKLAEDSGVVCNVRELQIFGRVMQGITPALIALEHPDYPLELKINHSIHAIRVLAVELHDKKLEYAANILDNIHWLAQVTLPELTDQTTIIQALQNLDVSVGVMTVRSIETKALEIGLTKQEVTQIVYAGTAINKLGSQDQELLTRTQENQQYAAIFGYLAKLAKDTNQVELNKAAIIGICLTSLRQTFYEVKANSLNIENFSESLGTILSGAGIVTNNRMLIHVGNSILTGLKTYTGIMALPGGAAVAVPLAVGSILGKLILKPDVKPNPATQLPNVIVSALGKVVELQQQMRKELATIYANLTVQHQQLMLIVDQGFANLANLLRTQNLQLIHSIQTVDKHLHNLHIELSQEFTSLYLEYVQQPLEEIEFAQKYDVIDAKNLLNHKHKLALWLLYKSKNPKVNGLSLSVNDIEKLLDRLQQADAILSLINRYLNINFAQNLPEDLPHIPTWILAANTYVTLSLQTPHLLTLGNELQILQDVIMAGNKIINFVDGLVANHDLWQKLQQAIMQSLMLVQTKWSLLQLQTPVIYLASVDEIIQKSTVQDADLIAYPGSEQQLERFSAIGVNVQNIWQRYIKDFIPQECVAAVAHNLGEWQINFTVDQRVNHFAHLHIKYGANLLPDYARDVLFRVDVAFKNKSDNKSYEIISIWLAFDLQDAQQRFNQYYQRKFKYALKHTRYNWIGLDGLSNQVDGHGNTATQKLIDYDRLALLYHDWLTQAAPINTPTTLLRIKENADFAQAYPALINGDEYFTLQTDNIGLLRIMLHNELRNLVLQQRIAIAQIILQEKQLAENLEKLEVYNAVSSVLLQILNTPFTRQKYLQDFLGLVQTLRQPEALNKNIFVEFDLLFSYLNANLPTFANYKQGKFYQQMQTTITRLALLQQNIILEPNFSEHLFGGIA